MVTFVFSFELRDSGIPSVREVAALGPEAMAHRPSARPHPNNYQAFPVPVGLLYDTVK